MRIIVARILAFALPLLAVSVAYSAPRNVLIDRGNTEAVVATDPSNPRLVIVGANPNFGVPVGGIYPMPAYVSHDGGKTFHRSVAPLPAAYVSSTDPQLAFSSSGTVFYSFAGVHPGSATCANCQCTETQKPHGAILVSRSVNGGNFGPPTVVDTSVNADRPGLAVESVPNHRSHVFMTWTRSESDVWYARSLNGGVTFSQPRQLYQSVYGDAPALPVEISPGHVAVAWIETSGDNSDGTVSARILARTSTDDGQAFGPVQIVVPWMKTMPRQVQPGNLRTTPSLAVASDRQGAVYFAWTQVRTVNSDKSVDTDIKLTWSLNGASSWHAPVSVNDSDLRDRFMPAMSVFPDGSVGVAFYDRRVGPNDLSVYAVHVAVRGGYRRSANVAVSGHYANISVIHQIPSSSACGSVAPGRFFGDYMGTSTTGARTLRVAWADSGLGVQEETDVWFAGVRLPVLSALTLDRFTAVEKSTPLRE